MGYQEKVAIINELAAALEKQAPNHPALAKWKESGGTDSLLNDAWQELASEAVQTKNDEDGYGLSEDELAEAKYYYLKYHDDSELLEESIAHAQK